MHREFISSAVAEMAKKNTGSMLPPSEKPWLVSRLGMVPKRGTSKFRLTINMMYVHRYLCQKAFKLEGLKGLADMVER